MKRKLVLTVLAAAMALAGAAPTFAGINDGNGNGNPDTNAAGNCPAGQNKETSPGGLKKC